MMSMLPYFTASLENHILSLLGFSGSQKFSKNDETELVSGRQIILSSTSFEEEGKKSQVLVIITKVEMFPSATGEFSFNSQYFWDIFLRVDFSKIAMDVGTKKMELNLVLAVWNLYSKCCLWWQQI